MNFRLLWILMVGLFAYLLFWEWSQESAAKAELVATTRVDEVSSDVDSIDSSNASKITNGSITLVVDNSSGSIIGVELSEYPVLQKAGSPNVRLLGSEGAFKFYVKSGFGVESPAFSLKNNDGSSITLVSDDGLYKKVISIKQGYLVDINDSYLGGNKPGDPFVAMYRTDGKPWTLQTHGLITPHMLGWPLILLMIPMIVTGCALLMKDLCLIRLVVGLVLFKSIF